MQKNRLEWQTFFSAAKMVLDASAKADKILKLRLGSGFNTFDWIEPNENRLSDLLRDLLDPVGTHGQGSIFLKLALEHLIPTPDIPTLDSISSEALDQSVIIREALTSNGRFIDLVINFHDCGIGIENKPFAAEQDAQLTDYADHLARHFDNRFCLVFLHGPGMQAGSLDVKRKEALIAEKRFLEVPYHAESGASLHDWLLHCAAAAQSEKVRSFLMDFVAYVVGNFSLPSKGIA